MRTLEIGLRSGPLLAGVLVGCALGLAWPAEAAPKRVLVVSVTAGFPHSVIPLSEKVLAELGRESGAFTVEYARVDRTDPALKGPDGKVDRDKELAAMAKVLAVKMSRAALEKYDALVFDNTTGELPVPDKQALLDYIKSGKGFVGIHASTDTFHKWAAFVEMQGAQFKTHGAQVAVDIINQDPTFPGCRHLPSTWEVFDEIYQFKNFDRSKVHGLLTLDKHPNDKTPGDYPVSWCKEYGGGRAPLPANGAARLIQKDWQMKPGRVFYTSLGHREDLWDPNWPDRKNSKEVTEAFRKHLLGGIKWALGLEQWRPRPQKAAAK